VEQTFNSSSALSRYVMTFKSERWGTTAESLVIAFAALLASGLLFSLFLVLLGKNPAQFFGLIWQGGFGSSFSFQNTLQRAAPLILTGLAFAIPAKIGMTMIGAEGALVLGGFSAAAVAVPFVANGEPVVLTMFVMVMAAVLTGALWTGLAGWLKYKRGVNETISTLLLTYIAIATLNFFVEGPFRDPLSKNKPSTVPIGPDYMIGSLPGMDVHWGLAAGLLLAVLLHILMTRTTFGFAVRISGGNVRAALAQGLPVGRLILTCSAIAGMCAGLAGFYEIAAVHGQANASLAARYGFTGILVSFLARHNALAVVPVAILFGAIEAAGGLIQRRMDMPDATALVLQGIIFVVLLASETAYGRFALFQPKLEATRN
jgi:general nucleoside transport system permease protein